MVYGCGAKLAKFLIILFNLLAFIAGLAILITCVVAYTNGPAKAQIMDVLEQAGLDQDVKPVNSILIAGMVVGAIVAILSFVGCCGGMMENICLLGTHSALMIILLIIQLGLAIAIFAFKGKVRDAFAEGINKLGDKAAEGDKDACNAFNDFANTFKCCGANGKFYPACVIKGKTTQCDLETMGKPCNKEIWNWTWSNIKIFGIVGLVFFIIEVAAVIFSCCLIRGIKRSQYGTV